MPQLIQKWEAEKILPQFVDYGRAKQFIGTGGIRTEDDAIVTETGVRMPGKRLPISPEEIEALY
jgi:Xaa-Pro aminopeptidase